MSYGGVQVPLTHAKQPSSVFGSLQLSVPPEPEPEPEPEPLQSEGHVAGDSLAWQTKSPHVAVALPEPEPGP